MAITSIITELATSALSAVGASSTTSSYESKHSSDDSLRMTPIQTLYSTDFSGRAYIKVDGYSGPSAAASSTSTGISSLDSSLLSGVISSITSSSSADTDGIPIDLLVQSMDFSLSEHHQVDEYIGNNYGAVFFGKAPSVVTVEALLADNSVAHGKQALLTAYKNHLRMTAVASTGKIPSFVCKGFTFKGPWITLRVTENAATEDILAVSFSILIFSISGKATDASFSLDYTHGVGDTSTTTTTEEVSSTVSNSTVTDSETSIVGNAGVSDVLEYSGW